MIYFDVYTDGSFLTASEGAHGGIVYVDYNTQKVLSWLHVESSYQPIVSMRNVGGELLALWSAIVSITGKIKSDAQNGIKETYVASFTYDYKGLGCWLTGEWQAKNPMVKWFINDIWKRIDSCPNLSIKLYWIKGHNGVRFNEFADSVASVYPNERPDNTIVCDMDELLHEFMNT